MKISTHLYILIGVYFGFTRTTGSFDPYRHNVTKPANSGFIQLDPSSWWYRIVYDDNYVRNSLEERYPYLRTPDGSYAGLRDKFNFSQVFWPSEEHLAKINVEQHIYDEHRAMDLMTVQTSMDIWSYSDANELARSGGPRKDDSKCQRDFERLFSELELAEKDPNRLFSKGATNIEFLRWIDSWGRPPSETYFGNSYWTGSYRGCKYAEVNFDRAKAIPTEPIKFNYCWAKLTPKDYPLKDEMNPKMSFRVGVCLPESCDTIQANKLKSKILQMLAFNFSPMHRLRFDRILDIYCLPHLEPILGSPATMPQPVFWFLLITLSWLAFIMGASLYHWLVPQALHGSNVEGSNERQHMWHKSFSIQENLRVFLADDEPPTNLRVDLRALGIVKLLTCLMVAAGHCFLQSYWNFHSSTIMVYECRRFIYHVMQFTWKSLEIFWVTTGLITGYFIISKFPGSSIKRIIQPRNFILLQLIRYVRLAPVLAFACAFMKALFIRFSDGPFWDYGTWKISPQGACQAVSWWRILIWPIILDPWAKGGSPYQHECLPSSWYVVTELKMYLIIPFFVFVLVSWRRFQIPIMMAVIAGTSMFKYLQLQAQQLAYWDQLLTYGQMHVHNLFIVSLDSAYFTVLDRFHSMAIGLFAGLHLYRYKAGKIDQWPFWMRRIFPVVFLAWQFYDLFFNTRSMEVRFRSTGEIPTEANTKLWLVMKPRIDAIMTAVLALLITTDWAPLVMRHTLSIYKLSRLTYCVYIVHTLVIMFFTTAHEKLRPDTVPLQLIMMGTFVILISFVIALPVYLFIESPIAMLVDFCLAKYKPSTVLTHTSSAVAINRMIVSEKTNSRHGGHMGQGRSGAKQKSS